MDSHWQLPPSYDSEPSTSTSTSSSPVYSPVAGELERVLHGSQQYETQGNVSGSQSTYIYKTEHMMLTLGPKVWSTPYPAYGKNGIVEGSLTLYGCPKHITRVTIRLDGRIIVNFTRRGQVVGGRRDRLMRHTIDIEHEEERDSVTSDVHHFSIPFPTYVSGGTSPLPHSNATHHPGVSCDIMYRLKVNMVRTWLRRHETIHVPLLYLPKSYCSVQSLQEIIPSWGNRSNPSSYLIAPNRTKVIAMRGYLPTPAAKQAPLVYLAVPSVLKYASVESIPVTLTIACLECPQVAKLLASNVRLDLIKRSSIQFPGRGEASVRETILGSADNLGVDESCQGVSVLFYELRCHERTMTCSWRLRNAVEETHLIRVVVKPPGNAAKYALPMYQHDEAVEISTDPWDAAERESLALGGIPAPALGLLHPALRTSRGSERISFSSAT